MKASQKHAHQLSKADIISAMAEEPINCELHLGISAQRILQSILWDAAETKWNEAHSHVLDYILAELATTLIHPVK